MNTRDTARRLNQDSIPIKPAISEQMLTGSRVDGQEVQDSRFETFSNSAGGAVELYEGIEDDNLIPKIYLIQFGQLEEFIHEYFFKIPQDQGINKTQMLGNHRSERKQFPSQQQQEHFRLDQSHLKLEQASSDQVNKFDLQFQMFQQLEASRKDERNLENVIRERELVLKEKQMVLEEKRMVLQEKKMALMQREMTFKENQDLQRQQELALLREAMTTIAKQQEKIIDMLQTNQKRGEE